MPALTRRQALLGLVMALMLAVAGTVSAPWVGIATPSPANPLQSGAWPAYTGAYDGVYAAYQRATGDTRTQLAKIALQPRVYWFTNGSRPEGADRLVRQRIQEYQQGDPTAFAQLAIFGLYPQGEDRRKQPFTNAMQATYRAWINKVAQGIGTSKAIVVLEPDLAVAYTGSRPLRRFALAAYASRVLSKLPNVVIYLDASDADWLPPAKAVQMLTRSGIRNVRGFALGATHYASAESNIVYGADLVNRLAARGYPGKHFVIDTADNGAAFTYPQFFAKHPKGDFDNANICHTTTETLCATLGIAPTTDVANPRWGMSAAARAAAARSCDAFLWFGRIWLYRQAWPFKLGRAVQAARTTPWQ